MATSAWINNVSFFYPLGNTPAVCLTQDLTYEEKAKVLLLGCGDVRNILFTVYADGGCREYGFLLFPYPSLTYIASRPFDITCCDIASAVLGQ
jgi:hypothetical protein